MAFDTICDFMAVVRRLNHCKYADKKFNAIFLEVHHSNYAARQLYQKLGFKMNRVRKNYYSDGGDALEMMLNCSTG